MSGKKLNLDNKIENIIENKIDKTPEKTTAQAELLFNRLVKRYRHLRKWARRIKTNAFRLYDRDIPEIPLVLDLYDNAVSGALYKRPYEKDEAEEIIWLDAMTAAISNAINIKCENIFLKTRERQSGKNQYGPLGKKNIWKDVCENNLKYRVNISDYLDTGLFPDARKKRNFLVNEAKDKCVLNLYSYTCSLSVAAAVGGALCVDSVDMSNTYLDWGEVNFALNGFSAQKSDGREFRYAKSEENTFTLIRSDVFPFLRKASENRVTWDLIILDPPAFSNSKKMRNDLDIKRDYKDLIQRCLSILNPGGRILFSTHVRGFQMDEADFPRLKIEDITEKLRDEDFRGKRIPSCWEISPDKFLTQ